jgi:hypothetical protein
LKTLPVALRSRLRLLAKIQQAASRAKSSAAATTEPMAIPAIAPLDRPLSLFAAGAPVADDVGIALDVEVGNKVGFTENCGKTTS